MPYAAMTNAPYAPGSDTSRDAARKTTGLLFDRINPEPMRDDAATLGMARATAHAEADRRPCVQCGRVVAHTQRGRAYVHRCRVEMLGGGA